MAEARARKGKRKQYGIKVFDKNKTKNLLDLQSSLINKTYTTSPYTTFTIYEPKKREIYRLPYFPDRIVHHAIMNKMEDIFVRTFTADTYSCIKTRGVHSMGRAIAHALKDAPNTQHFLQLDIKQFYPSINHDILKALLRRKIKDNNLLWLLDNIIDSASGVPIGNYLSQYLANFYITPFDHWIKERKLVFNYFRYSDDMLILASTKKYLQNLVIEIIEYFKTNLKLTVKPNYTIAPVRCQGIDIGGYVYYHTHIRLRKWIKQRFARAVSRHKGQCTLASYTGLAKHANCINLVNKILPNEAI